MLSQDSPTPPLEELKTYLDTAVSIAKEAGALLQEGVGQHKEIDQKSSSVDWVTQFDKASEVLIVERLQAAFPEHGILGEEGGRQAGSSDLTWYVDPLDGTNNYAHGFPVYSVAMGLYSGETPLVGVVYDPNLEECFTAMRGQGAALTRPNGTRQLKVSDTTELGQSLLATGFPYDRQDGNHNNLAEVGAFLLAAQGIRRPGSAALDIVNVAAGRFDGYWEFKLYPWDMAAARVILEEAGGKITQPNGEPIAMVERPSMAVSNGHIHQQMVDILAQVARENGRPHDFPTQNT